MTATAVKERPILFSGPMVKAILSGAKTQTRRIVKGSTAEWRFDGFANPSLGPCRAGFRYPNGKGSYHKSRYGGPGDRLFVREALRWKDGAIRYDADDEPVANVPPSVSCVREFIPSIFCPAWATRLHLEITDVRVQRIQEITYDDAAAEGVRAWDGHQGCPGCIAGECAGTRSTGRCETFMLGYKETFRKLWNEINGPGAWERNDWCWAITFRRVERLDA